MWRRLGHREGWNRSLASKYADLDGCGGALLARRQATASGSEMRVGIK